MYSHKNGFFGSVKPSSRAETILENANPGTFLVRLNLGENQSISDGPFTITLKTKGGYVHSRTLPSKLKGGFWCKVGDKKIKAQASLIDLVDHMIKEGVLSDACTGWPFQILFTKKLSVTYGPVADESNSEESD